MFITSIISCCKLDFISIVNVFHTCAFMFCVYLKTCQRKLQTCLYITFSFWTRKETNLITSILEIIVSLGSFSKQWYNVLSENTQRWDWATGDILCPLAQTFTHQAVHSVYPLSVTKNQQNDQTVPILWKEKIYNMIWPNFQYDTTVGCNCL